MLPANQNILIERLALTFIKDIGPRRAKALLSYFGEIKDIFKASLKDLMRAEGLGEHLARGLKSEIDSAFKRSEEELLFIEKNNIKLLWHEDEEYPSRLRQCIDAPILLFYDGKADLNSEKTVAVIGTRKYTDYGQRICDDFVASLTDQQNMLIVSGLAHGIDTMAHKNALKHNLPTVGVLGHGLDRIYPATNRQLAKEMTVAGGLLTEFPSGTIADRTNFPMRNRIVAGISDVTVVVESDITGGALITARIASSYNRDVAAFPGRVHDSKSSGCNELIRTNIASMITNANDLLTLMGWEKSKKPKAMQKQLFIDLTADERTIIDILQTKDMVHADELFHKAGLPNSLLAATLLQLEMQDLVKALPGKYYRLN